jgi:hypothetical protein
MSGVTPFMLAAATGDVALMKAMLAKGADPMAATDDGVTAMMVAAGVGVGSDRTPEEEKGALEAVKMLVEVGADVNAATKTLGYTALNGAAYNGSNDIIQYLVEKGANLNVKDKMGQTPLSIAEGDPNLLSDDFERRAHPKTAELIRKLGGDPLADSDFEGLPDRLANDQRDFDSRLFAVGRQVKVAFVNRSALHIRREVVSESEHPVGKLFIKIVVPRQHDELGAELASLARGHRRINPKLAGFVGCRSDDSSTFTAHRDGFTPQPGVGGLLDGREESVRVQMHNGPWHGKSSGFPSLQFSQCVASNPSRCS